MKITCATCLNEENRYCKVKKATVTLNRRRNCDKYVLEATKVKEKQVLKTIKVSYQEREALRKEYKEQLKTFRDAAKKGNVVPHNMKHPLTGNLDRFTSTAGDK
jgi:hypothetical protein